MDLPLDRPLIARWTAPRFRGKKAIQTHTQHGFGAAVIGARARLSALHEGGGPDQGLGLPAHSPVHPTLRVVLRVEESLSGCVRAR